MDRREPTIDVPAQPSHRAEQRAAAARRGRARSTARTFGSTVEALEGLALGGARVAVHVIELDRGEPVLAGDDHMPLPVGGLGVVPLLVEVAAQFDAGALDPFELSDRSDLDDAGACGVWRLLAAPTLPLADLAVLAASSGDALAANALLDRVSHENVTRRLVSLGMPRSALLDRFREERGPDDAPVLALGTAREYATLFAALAARTVVNRDVSERVTDWLTPSSDAGLVGAMLGIDPFWHDADAHGLVHFGRTGREAGARAEAGVIAGRRAAFAYAMIVAFEDLSPLHRHRAHSAFHALGRDLMEYAT